MSNNDHKFWIGIASAFIMPTLAYVYSQGITAQSISQLTISVDKYQSSIDSLNVQLVVMANSNNNNKDSIVEINKNIDQIAMELNQQNRRIIIIETKQNKG